MEALVASHRTRVIVTRDLPAGQITAQGDAVEILKTPVHRRNVRPDAPQPPISVQSIGVSRGARAFGWRQVRAHVSLAVSAGVVAHLRSWDH